MKQRVKREREKRPVGVEETEKMRRKWEKRRRREEEDSKENGTKEHGITLHRKQYSQIN